MPDHGGNRTYDLWNTSLGSIPTVIRHIFQACPVWIYTQSTITSIIYSPEYFTPTQEKIILNDCCAPNLKELLMRRNSLQSNSGDLRNSHTDLALPKQGREFLKKAVFTVSVVLNFGIIFRAKLRKRNQFILFQKLCKTI